MSNHAYPQKRSFIINQRRRYCLELAQKRQERSALRNSRLYYNRKEHTIREVWSFVVPKNNTTMLLYGVCLVLQEMQKGTEPRPSRFHPPVPSGSTLCLGVIDFAGSGVVHMLGGGVGLLLAWTTHPREGRFFSAAGTPQGSNQTIRRTNHTPVAQLNERDFRPNDPSWMTLGCFLLWFGWCACVHLG